MVKLSSLKLMFQNNKKVVENYFFMTVLQVLNSLFYLLIYPYLIRVLGADSYGLYVFSMSIVTYFITFVGYGFELPAVKAIAQNTDSLESKTHTLSCVFTAKIYLELVSVFVFVFLVLFIPNLKHNWILLSLCFIQTFSGILFPQWYFQGVQRMRTVTYIQLIFKLISLPFIFIFIKNPSDIWLFALITSLVSLLGAITASITLRYYDKIKIQLVSFSDVRYWFKEAFPFFLSSSTTIIKEQSIVLVIGLFFSMRDVAIYDLANKIILVPRTLLFGLNGAIFPKIIADVKAERVKQIIRIETFIGLSVLAIVAVFGKFFVMLLGGANMIQSYPAAIILSVTVLTWLVVGSYISFVFIPQNKNYSVSMNQIVAFLSLFIYCVVGFLFVKSIFVLIVAISLSGLTEVLYCKIIVNKYNLLKTNALNS